MVVERTKYVRELKQILNSYLSCPKSVAQVHIVGDILVVDIRIKHRNLRDSQKIDLTYHDCFALPTEFTYGCAKVQASIIRDCYNSFLDSAYMP